MLKDRILEFLQERKRISGGHNGAYLVEIIQETRSNAEEVKRALTELAKEKQIRKAPGARGVLVMMRK